MQLFIEIGVGKLFYNLSLTCRLSSDVCMQICMWTLGLRVIFAALIGPHDTAVTVGSVATFTCTTDSPEPCFTWKQKATELDEYRRLYHGNTLAPGCKCNVTLSNNNRTRSLTINDVQLTDAGFYKCSDCWNINSSTTKLSVIGHDTKYL